MRVLIQRTQYLGAQPCQYSYRLYVQKESLPRDRVTCIRGGSFMPDSRIEYCSIEDAITPMSAMVLPPGDEKYDAHVYWSKVAKAIENEVCRKYFPETRDRRDPTTLWCSYPQPLTDGDRHRTVLGSSDVGWRVLVLEESGQFFVYLIDKSWADQFASVDQLVAHYSQAEQRQFKFVLFIEETLHYGNDLH